MTSIQCLLSTLGVSNQLKGSASVWLQEGLDAKPKKHGLHSDYPSQMRKHTNKGKREDISEHTDILTSYN